MDQAEAVRRANHARTMQKAINFHLEHNGEVLERAKKQSHTIGAGVYVRLTKSGNLAIAYSTHVKPGELEWASEILDDDAVDGS